MVTSKNETQPRFPEIYDFPGNRVIFLYYLRENGITWGKCHASLADIKS